VIWLWLLLTIWLVGATGGAVAAWRRTGHTLDDAKRLSPTLRFRRRR
jgi:hypothetical protein